MGERFKSPASCLRLIPPRARLSVVSEFCGLFGRRGTVAVSHKTFHAIKKTAIHHLSVEPVVEKSRAEFYRTLEVPELRSDLRNLEGDVTYESKNALKFPAILWSLRCKAFLRLLARAVDFLSPSEGREARSTVRNLGWGWMQVVVGAAILDSFPDRCYKPDSIFCLFLRHGHVPVLNRFSSNSQLPWDRSEVPQG